MNSNVNQSLDALPDEKEIENKLITQSDIFEYVETMECKCGYEKLQFITVSPVPNEFINLGFTNDLFVYICSMCKNQIKIKQNGTTFIYCPNLEPNGMHPGNYYLCLDCLIISIRKDQILNWKKQKNINIMSD